MSHHQHCTTHIWHGTRTSACACNGSPPFTVRQYDGHHYVVEAAQKTHVGEKDAERQRHTHIRTRKRGAYEGATTRAHTMHHTYTTHGRAGAAYEGCLQRHSKSPTS